MSKKSFSAIFLTLGLLLFNAAALWADNEGQEDLDKATETKLTASKLNDYNEVIRLIDSAIEKGLDSSNREFADKLLASTLVQRAQAVAGAISAAGATDAKWMQLRQAALKDLERAVGIETNIPMAHLLIAQLNALPGGDVKKAKEAVDKAVETAGDDVGLKAKALVLRSNFQDNLEKRLPDLDEAVKLAPNEVSIIRTRGIIYGELKKLDESIADLDKAIELEPDNVPTYEIKAMVLAQNKKYDEAQAVLDKAASMLDDPAPMYLQKMKIHVVAGDKKAAIEDLTKAFELNRGNLDVLLLRATLYLEVKDKDKAKADMLEALRLRPNHPEATRLYASFLAGEGNFDEAVSMLKKLHARRPTDPQVLVELGTYLIKTKKSSDAIDLYSKFLQRNPNSAIILRCRGDAYLNTARHAEAIADFKKAYAIDAKDSGLLNNYAWVLATSPVDSLRDGKKAVELADEANKIADGKMAHILSTLAAAYAETGDFEKAREIVKKGLEIAQGDDKVSLEKELASYEANKPWREIINDEEPKKLKDDSAPSKKDAPGKNEGKTTPPASSGSVPVLDL